MTHKHLAITAEKKLIK